VRYHEPHIGIAAVKVLEALGFEVALVKKRQCCGRPAFSQGNLDAATRVGKHNVDLLNSAGSQQSTINYQLSSTPILFLEPSCWSMFVDDYRELKIDNAEQVAARCFLFEKFIDDLLDRDPDAWQFKDRSTFAGGLGRDGQINVAIHPHCHAKSLMNPAFMARLVERLPGRKAQLLDTGCCGMAGAFGALAEKYTLSVQVAADLLNKIDKEQPDVIVASGTSCRHQIADLIPQSRGTRPKHMAELLAEAIA
jgi:Fe-S oxidoreductase